MFLKPGGLASLRLFGHFLRIYSYVFETVLCAGGLLLSVFTLASRNVNVFVPWLPWAGASQIRWILALSILGICSVALAVFGMLRTLLFLFSALVLGVLLRGLFFNAQYVFPGKDGARNAVILILGALLAFVGSYPGFYGQRRRA